MMKIIRIDRGRVDIDLDGHVLRIYGEAMIPQKAPELSEYIIYRNSLEWLNTPLNSNEFDIESVYMYLKKEFNNRGMNLIIE